MSVSFKLTADGDAVGKQIDDILKRSKSLHDDLHIALCNCLVQVLAHRNSTPLARMLNALYTDTSIGVGSIKPWAEDHVPITITFDKSTKVISVELNDFKRMSADDAIAKAKSWPKFWRFVPPVDPFNTYSVEKKFSALVDEAKRMARAKATGKLKRKGKVETLTQAQRDAIDLSGWEKIIGGSVPKFESIEDVAENMGLPVSPATNTTMTIN